VDLTGYSRAQIMQKGKDEPSDRLNLFNTWILICMYCAHFYSIANKTQISQTPAPNSAVHETGCSCHFLYGPDTKEEHKQQIEKSLSNKMELKLEVIFYKKEGKPSAKLPLCGNAVRIVFYLPRF